MSAGTPSADSLLPRIAALKDIFLLLESWLKDEDALFKISDYDTPLKDALALHFALLGSAEEFSWQDNLEAAQTHFERLDWVADTKRVAEARRLLTDKHKWLTIGCGTKQLEHETRRLLVLSGRALLDLRRYVHTRLAQLNSMADGYGQASVDVSRPDQTKIPPGNKEVSLRPEHVLSLEAPNDEAIAAAAIRDATLGSTRWAEHYGVEPEALRKRLDRWRKENAASADFIDTGDASGRKPRYLYTMKIVEPIALELKAASGKRPSK